MLLLIILRTEEEEMSHVWLCIPSAAPAPRLNEALARWQQLGYYTAIFRDIESRPLLHDGVWTNVVDADITHYGKYEGYAAAVNKLCHAVTKQHPEAEWFVAGGDDIQPDPSHHAHDIAKECNSYFGGTFGIMEPTGDRWLEDAEGKCSAERVCIAPWMGREWVDHGYAGKGPYPEGYYHFFADEELKLVAERLGMLWQRPDLTQYHDNWQREGGRQRPAYLEKAAKARDRDLALFLERKAAGFPGSGPQ